VTITSILVVYVVVWFLTLFVVLPLNVRSQSEDGSIVPGTPGSAPTDPMIRTKLKWVTLVATLIWAALCAFIQWGGLTIHDIDIWGRM